MNNGLKIPLMGIGTYGDPRTVRGYWPILSSFLIVCFLIDLHLYLHLLAEFDRLPKEPHITQSSWPSRLDTGTSMELWCTSMSTKWAKLSETKLLMEPWKERTFSIAERFVLRRKSHALLICCDILWCKESDQWTWSTEQRVNVLLVFVLRVYTVR